MLLNDVGLLNTCTRGIKALHDLTRKYSHHCPVVSSLCGSATRLRWKRSDIRYDTKWHHTARYDTDRWASARYLTGGLSLCSGAAFKFWCHPMLLLCTSELWYFVYLSFFKCFKVALRYIQLSLHFSYGFEHILAHRISISLLRSSIAHVA